MPIQSILTALTGNLAARRHTDLLRKHADLAYNTGRLGMTHFRLTDLIDFDSDMTAPEIQDKHPATERPEKITPMIAYYLRVTFKGAQTLEFTLLPSDLIPI